MQKRKSIAYAYPSSIAAKQLDMAKTGCFYVQEEIKNEVGMWQSYIPHDAEGFIEPDAPDLISLYMETDAAMCPYFARHGNVKALKAIAARVSAGLKEGA